MKKQIIRRNDQGEVISVKEYGVDRSATLTCPKCSEEVDYLLGDVDSFGNDNRACEKCYVAPANPEKRTEAVMPVGDEDQVGQIRGTAPKAMSADELLKSLGVKK